MIVTGALVGVEEKREGSAASAAASVGASAVTVENGNHFRETGICQVGVDDDAVSYVYTLGDDGLTLNLEDPLSVAVEVGTPVLSLSDTSLPESQVFVYVQLADGQPPVRAVVPSAMRTLALSDSLLVGGLVEIQTTPDGYMVVSLPFDEPTIDQAYVSNPNIGKLVLPTAESVPNAVDGWLIAGWVKDGTFADVTSIGTSGSATGAISLASGTYLVIVTIRFASGTGRRRVRMTRQGSGAAEDVAETRVVADGTTATQLSAIVRGGTFADRLRVGVYQDSGGALDVTATGTQIQIVRLG